jgi:SLOG family YspA-like protein
VTSLVAISKVLYHGTSEDRWRKIRRHGLRQGKGPFGPGVYTAVTAEMPHHYYAVHGDNPDIIDRHYTTEEAARLKQRSRHGRLITIDDEGLKSDLVKPKDKGSGRQLPQREWESVVREDIKPSRITHSQRVHPAKRVYDQPHGNYRLVGSSAERWYDNPLALEQRIAGVRHTYGAPTESPAVQARIAASQAKRKKVLEANAARHPKGGRAPAPAPTIKTRNRTMRRFHEELGDVGAKHLVRRKAATAGATAALGTATAATAGLVARAGAKKKALAARAARKTRTLKLAALGAVPAAVAGGLALNKADDVIVPRAVEHAIRAQHAPEHHEAKMEEARGYYRQLRDMRRQELADLRKPDPSGPPQIKPSAAQVVRIEQHKAKKKQWALIKRKKKRPIKWPSNRTPPEVTGNEVQKGLPSALRGKAPEEAVSLYARDRIKAKAAGQKVASLMGQRGKGMSIGSTMRHGKELRARSRRFMEMGAEGIPADRVTTPARVRAPQSPRLWEPDTRIGIGTSKYNPEGQARNAANRATNKAHLVEAEQRIVDAWKKDIGKAWHRPDYDVVVTGSRDISDKDRKRIRRDLSRTQLVRPHKRLVVHHGGASGADDAAGEWAWDKRKDQAIHPANWAKHGRAAGPIRNKQMLQRAQPKKVLAYPKGESKGTRGAIAEAKKQGYKVKVRELKKSEELLRAQAANRVANAQWAKKHPEWVEQHKQINAVPAAERKASRGRASRTRLSLETTKKPIVAHEGTLPEKRKGLRRLIPKRHKRLVEENWAEGAPRNRSVVGKSDEISKWKGYAYNRVRKRYNRLRRRRY